MVKALMPNGAYTLTPTPREFLNLENFQRSRVCLNCYQLGAVPTDSIHLDRVIPGDKAIPPGKVPGWPPPARSSAGPGYIGSSSIWYRDAKINEPSRVPPLAPTPAQPRSLL